MKNLLYTAIVCCLIISCNWDSKQSKASKTENNRRVKDTTITYDLDGISSEGAGAEANYIDGKIKKCTINVYGEMGQAELIYDFQKNQINVIVKNINYAIESDSINNQKWTSEKEVKYAVDYNGLLLSGNVEEKGFVDLFKELKENVPFELTEN